MAGVEAWSEHQPMTAARERDPGPGALASQAAEAVDTASHTYRSSPSLWRKRLHSRLRSHLWRRLSLSAASIAAVALLISICSRSQSMRHAFHSDTRQLSDNMGTKRGFEDLCGSGAHDEEAWLDGGDADSKEPLQKKPRLVEEATGRSRPGQLLEGPPDAGKHAGDPSTPPHQRDSHNDTSHLPSSQSSSSAAPRMWTRSDMEAAAALFQLRLSPRYTVHVGKVAGHGGHVMYVEQSKKMPEAQAHTEGGTKRKIVVLGTFLSAAETASTRSFGIVTGRTAGPSAGNAAGTAAGTATVPAAATSAGATAGKATGLIASPSAGSAAGLAAGSAAQNAAGTTPTTSAGTLPGPAYGANAAPGTSKGTGYIPSLEHPYFRLPWIDAGQTIVRFNPERAMSVNLAPQSPVDLLVTAHGLLLKTYLTLDELHTLTTTAEQLASHLIVFQGRTLPATRPARAVTMLGVRYLAFDIIVSTLQILGQPPSGEWWNRITASVPHIYDSPYLQQSARRDVIFNRELLKSLMKALDLLKMGKRPSREETILLKRRLFTSIYSPQRFQDKQFDPWRQDLTGPQKQE